VTELIDTTEMYLRTVFELEEEGIPALRARIVERLGHSGPTVSQTVARMERDRLLTVLPDRSIELSTEGRLRAIRVMRKHRLAERLLLDVIGLEYEYVHAEACRWEHVMSERVERKIVAMLAEHDASPYGNPIPGLEELGLHETPVVRAGLVQLVDLDPQQPCVVVLRNLGEPVQDDVGALTLLRDAGLRVGGSMEVRREGNRFLVKALNVQGGMDGHESVSLPEDVASHIFVSVPRPSVLAGSETVDAAESAASA
jgi:DtxR family transcriptional regulator, iron-dependent repressor